MTSLIFVKGPKNPKTLHLNINIKAAGDLFELVAALGSITDLTELHGNLTREIMYFSYKHTVHQKS